MSYGIYLFLMAWLRPYNLEVVARVFGLVSLGSFTVMPSWRCFRFFSSSARRDRMRRVHVVGSSLGLTALVLALVFVLLPQRVGELWNSNRVMCDGSMSTCRGESSAKRCSRAAR